MKKWTILVIVVLAAVLLFMQYLMEKRKSDTAIPGRPVQSAEPQLGVALPESATGYVSPAEVYLPPPAGVKSTGQISFPMPPTGYKGACEGGSLSDMLATHDKYWGFFARTAAFSQQDSQRMYALLGDYAACNAAARHDLGFCAYLPQSFERGTERSSEDMAPYQACWKNSLPVIYEGFRAGLVKDQSSCRYTMEQADRNIVSRFSIPEMCAELGKSRGAAETYLRNIFRDMPSSRADELLDTSFPEKAADCRKDQDCMNRYSTYAALKSGNGAACPKGTDAHCKALIERSVEPCDKVLQDMSQFYCATVAKVKKATGGYIGLSKDELKLELAKLKAQKTEADEMKKEQNKIMEEVNKRVREQKKNKGGGGE
jgi:hypothetical protein